MTRRRRTKPHAKRGSVSISCMASEMSAIPEEERAIDTRAVSELTGLAEITLVQQRARGEGPPFFRIGRSIRYRLGDVLSWRDARTVGGKR